MTEQPRPSQLMQDLGVVQAGDAILARPARPFELPDERPAAEHTLSQLREALDRIAAVHDFSKGMGLAAPQIGLPRAAAIVRPPTPGAEPIILLNPHIVSASAETDEQYEGCLSFFDVRGLVPRSLRITVQHTGLDGCTRRTGYSYALARLVAHEVDHLNGLFYTQRMRPNLTPIPLAQYRGTGQVWVY